MGQKARPRGSLQGEIGVELEVALLEVVHHGNHGVRRVDFEKHVDGPLLKAPGVTDHEKVVIEGGDESFNRLSLDDMDVPFLAKIFENLRPHGDAHLPQVVVDVDFPA